MERALHGREAGIRTHILVCVSASLLMLLMHYQWQLVPKEFLDTVRADPSRMAQGIMTGIGFLGAGVILKEGLSVRGLTTAASIWMTASIGIVIGLGFYLPALLTTILTFLALSVFRWFEGLLPVQRYAKFSVKFRRNQPHLDETALCDLITGHKIKAFQPTFRLTDEGHYIEYEMTIRSRGKDNFSQLAETLLSNADVQEFDITPL
jgi:putative Mg2+ transporter-C (MgtC) family protein